jgi:phosphatidylinositol alpha-1,6-mannosyltransferase
MKKILIVTLEYPPMIGGIGTYTYQFARALPPEKVVVLTLPAADAEQFDAAQPFLTIRKELFFKYFWPSWLKLYVVVRKLIKEHQIEQLHVHHMLPVGYVARLLQKKVPYLIFSHGTDMILATKTKWKRLQTIRIVSNAIRIIVNSESLRRRFIQQIPIVEKKVVVVYPCPDQSLLDVPPETTITSLRQTLALEHKKVILTVGRLDDGKGIPQMIRTISELLPTHPDIVWVLIGDGHKKQFIIDLIQKYRLQNTVRFLGSIPHDQLKPYYYIADVFVALTHPDGGKEEGLGLVFLEAAAAGLPIVAGKSGGVEEAVLHMQTGIVVNTYNTDEVKGAISKLLIDREFAGELGRAAKERIRTEFHWEQQLKQIEHWL